MKDRRKFQFFLLVLLFLVTGNFFVWKEVLGLDGNLEVVFFDVGQGDAIFVESPQGHQVLIDGGPSGETILKKLAGRMPFWDRTIDLVGLTHPDYDHLRGLLDVLDRYKVDNILWTGVMRETKTFERWLEKLEKEKEQGAEVFIAKKGQVIRVGDSQFFILHPLERLEGVMMEQSSNESSVVIKLVYGKNTFLLAGDISKKIEGKILEADCGNPTAASCGGRVAADILKVAHHGSKAASSKEFLQVVAPEVAVISCGKDNTYGHPHQEVLSNLAEFGITVLRTDELGDINVLADGNNYELPNFQNQN